MSESFFRRWARRKAETTHGEAGAVGAAGAEHVPASGTENGNALADAAGSHDGVRPDLPSMKDVAALAADADYSPFLARGVDKAVRRAAMKKLFSDPHFNVMDGLDIYIDDYTKPSPLPPGMLENLRHAKSTLDPKPLYETQDDDRGRQDPASQDEAGEAVDTDDAHVAGSQPEREDGAETEAETETEAEGAAAEHHADARRASADEEPPFAGHPPARHNPINSTEFPSP
jgi:hypothetical protein